MGYLKGQFASLWGLWQQIKNKHDHLLATYWILSCLILHNLIIQVEHAIDETDPFYIQILQEGQCHEDEEVNGVELFGTMMVDSYERTPGQQKHAELHGQLLQHLKD